MRYLKLICLTLLLSSLAITAQQNNAPNEAARNWWAHIAWLADDRLQGRDTGSAEHRQAAEYIASVFQRAGFKPGGTKGYRQPIKFRSRRIVEEKCSLALVRNGKAEPLVLGEDVTVNLRGENAPRRAAGVCRLGADGAGVELR